MQTIRNENFYTVLGWMLNVLGLKGNELIVFAIIYSFSQDGESEFTGSLSFLQTFANIKSKETMLTILQNLVNRNYIVKRDYMRGNIKRVAYRVNYDCVNGLIAGFTNISPNNQSDEP